MVKQMKRREFLKLSTGVGALAAGLTAPTILEAAVSSTKSKSDEIIKPYTYWALWFPKSVMSQHLYMGPDYRGRLDVQFKDQYSGVYGAMLFNGQRWLDKVGAHYNDIDASFTLDNIEAHYNGQASSLSKQLVHLYNRRYGPGEYQLKIQDCFCLYRPTIRTTAAGNEFLSQFDGDGDLSNVHTVADYAIKLMDDSNYINSAPAGYCESPEYVEELVRQQTKVKLPYYFKIVSSKLIDDVPGKYIDRERIFKVTVESNVTGIKQLNQSFTSTQLT